ncbi:YdaS family helix-turn-helix protein [Pasteurella skyensis]|uniref:YdaS family helix-turn-helix protein n=1 Tax=Phocoenobacter skyensis TaxID=97481 RepID=A0AAJ6NBD6_9PAST|nr:YdaS family helix-turn-helix protein [Pasteurella skyensis]MDP8173652.1 YdaS family helix-turn-helix protein [Pasteurella skyensis]MDP8178020.1 YdaS family helix-turn-helix protein [Pasteurella skyensis]
MINMISTAVNVCGGQEELAKKCGVSQGTVSNWVNGKTKKISFECIKKIEEIVKHKDQQNGTTK